MKHIFIIVLLLACLSLKAETLVGKIIKVSDGDTVVLLDKDNKQHKIRLHGIDAPEKGQDYSDKARLYLSGLIAGQTVEVDVKGRDIYKRVLGIIYLGELNINAEMIKAGYAWSYKYSKDKYYIKLQKEAKEAKRGLWQGENPIDPYNYRRLKTKNVI